MTVILSISLNYFRGFRHRFLKCGRIVSPIISVLAKLLSIIAGYRIMDYIGERANLQTYDGFILDDTVTHVSGATVWIFGLVVLVQTRFIGNMLKGELDKWSIIHGLLTSIAATELYKNPPSGVSIYAGLIALNLMMYFGQKGIDSMDRLMLESMAEKNHRRVFNLFWLASKLYSAGRLMVNVATIIVQSRRI